jgi:hypothetical protein
MDLDESLESPSFLNRMTPSKSLQRTFSFPALSIRGQAPTESMPPSPTKQLFGLRPVSSLRTLDDLDRRTLYETLSALLDQRCEGGNLIVLDE